MENYTTYNINIQNNKLDTVEKLILQINMVIEQYINTYMITVNWIIESSYLIDSLVVKIGKTKVNMVYLNDYALLPTKYFLFNVLFSNYRSTGKIHNINNYYSLNVC